MREFVAIDYETANEQRRSACAVGRLAGRIEIISGILLQKRFQIS